VELVIGVDLGGTKLLAGAIDEKLGVHHRVHRPVPADDLTALLDAIASAVTELREAVATTGNVTAVGYGIPCLIDRRAGLAASSNHLPIEGVAFAEVMAERVGLPAYVDNDANAAMLAEHRLGAARHARNAVMLTLGTGIGGGLIVEHQLYRGSRGAAAELGHVVVWADGPACGPGCPGRGCLEALASGRALEREARAAALEYRESALGRMAAEGREITGPAVTELAHDGDEVAREVLAGVGQWLGIGIAGFVNVFDPDVVVIGGGVIAGGDLLLEPARRALAERVLPMAGREVPVRPAHFGAESGMLGAALMAREEQR
jgi:glucokinase